MSAVVLCGSCQMGQHESHVAGEHKPGVLGGWDCPCKGDCKPPDLSSVFLPAPESQPLTEEEQIRLAWTYANGQYRDLPKAAVERMKKALPAFELIVNTRTADLRDRLKAAEGERDDYRLRYEAEQRMHRSSERMRKAEANRADAAEADKARAVAEALTVAYDRIAQRLAHLENPNEGAVAMQATALDIISALRNEGSGS